MMRIAFFTDTFSPQVNGVTNTFRYFSDYLRKNQIDHIFIAPDYDTEEADDAITSVVRFKGITPSLYPQCRLAYPSFHKIIKLLIDFQPDVVHIATELGIGLSGLRAARELDLPIIMSYHTNFDQYLNFYNLHYLNKALWAYLEWFHSFAKANLCPSQDTLRELETHNFPALGIWSRGVDLNQFNPEHYSERIRNEFGGRNKTIFLYVGRIAKEKGLDTLAESIRIVNKKYQNEVLFVFTGDGPYLNELSSLQIPNMVFTGFQHGKELAGIYASSDVFVFPSGTETFGNVMLEAMACGLPGICVNSGGVMDFATHEKNAFVCNYRNASSLADAMIKMLDSQLRTRIRQGAMKTAKQRSWNTIFDELMMRYEVLAARRRFLSRISR